MKKNIPVFDIEGAPLDCTSRFTADKMILKGKASEINHRGVFAIQLKKASTISQTLPIAQTPENLSNEGSEVVYNGIPETLGDTQLFKRLMELPLDKLPYLKFKALGKHYDPVRSQTVLYDLLHTNDLLASESLVEVQEIQADINYDLRDYTPEEDPKKQKWKLSEQEAKNLNCTAILHCIYIHAIKEFKVPYNLTYNAKYFFKSDPYLERFNFEVFK